MYLSRLRLNPAHRRARRDLGNLYDLHRTLCRAFVDEGAGTPARFLWRLEASRDTSLGTLLVQSMVRPKWEEIEARFPGYLAAVDVKEYLLPAHLHARQILRFRLCANPTVTREGKRHGLRSTMRQLQWLERQGARCGFAVVDCMISGSRLVRASHKTSGTVITVQAVTYDGFLRVDDPERLQGAIANGLGHAKVLGMGLLSVAPHG